MSRFVPVSFEKWAEMVKAQSDLVRYKEMCDELDAECTRLKAENEKYRRCFQAEGDWVLMEPSEHALLKAEVERLTPLLGDIVSFDEYFKLLQQVERLTKAGDAMAEDLIGEFGSYNSVYDWNAAKKGGQS